VLRCNKLRHLKIHTYCISYYSALFDRKPCLEPSAACLAVLAIPYLAIFPSSLCCMLHTDAAWNVGIIQEGTGRQVELSCASRNKGSSALHCRSVRIIKQYESMTGKLVALVLGQSFCLINYVLVTVRHYCLCVWERERETLRSVRSFLTRWRKLGGEREVFGVNDNTLGENKFIICCCCCFLFGWADLMNRERRNLGRYEQQ
jgi:hypothetical protein